MLEILITCQKSSQAHFFSSKILRWLKIRSIQYFEFTFSSNFEPSQDHMHITTRDIGSFDVFLSFLKVLSVILFCCILPVLLSSEYDEQLVVIVVISIVVSFVVFVFWVFILLVLKRNFFFWFEAIRIWSSFYKLHIKCNNIEFPNHRLLSKDS